MQVCDEKPKSRISFSFESSGLHIEIETERLCIRSYQEDDFEHCVLLYGDEKISKYFDHGKARSRQEVHDLVHEKGRKYFSKGEPFGLFSLFEKKNRNFVGQIDLVPTNEPGILEMGCILLRQFHNQGFPFEALQALMEDYVETLNSKGFRYNRHPITKLIATVHPKNFPSKKLVRNLGMVFEKSEERFGLPRLWYSYPTKTRAICP